MLRLKRANALLALSTVALLTSCAGSPPAVVKPELPEPPPLFAKPVPVPDVKIGDSVKTFALKNRAALIDANNRLKNDGAFYKDVRDNFSH